MNDESRSGQRQRRSQSYDFWIGGVKACLKVKLIEEMTFTLKCWTRERQLNVELLQRK